MSSRRGNPESEDPNFLDRLTGHLEKSLINVFNKYFLNAYQVSGTVYVVGDTTLNNIVKNSYLHGGIMVEKTDNKKNIHTNI